MASAGTLLSDLDSKTPVTDNDRDIVSQIMADMNIGQGSSNQIVQQSNIPPAPSGRVITSPNPNTTYPSAVDPATATAHMIGKSYPTPADFATLMNQGGGGGLQSSPYGQFGQAAAAPTLVNLNNNVSKGNWYSEILNQLRQPIMVGIIVFIVSLPAMNVLIGHYMPSLLRAGGDLTTSGMLLKSAVAGALFWTIQRVLVPLMAA